MESAGERPDLDALRELEEVLRHLSDELATWRRRALTAESRVADRSRFEEGSDGGAARLRELEERNRSLEQRLDTARARVSELLGRLGFLEQQARDTAGARLETAK